jgi:NAD-dependent SIR2 family protein deacetylase
MNEVDALGRAFTETQGLLLVVTGAGISLASGIPTFRGTDPGAVWARDVTELGTLAYFFEEPEGSWCWYLSRFEKVMGAQPNAAHHALVRLEQQRAAAKLPFLLVTQNVDGLHKAAGSQALVEVHGSAHRVRCSSVGCVNGSPRGSWPRSDFDLEKFLAEPTRANVPVCPACGEWVRQHVLWFDEMYTSHVDYQWQRVTKAAMMAQAVVFIGTSFSVGVTELIVSEALERGVPVFNVDPSGQQQRSVTLVREASEIVLPRLMSVPSTASR